MAFKNLFTLGLVVLLLSACGPLPENDSREDENIIGNKVQAVTDIQYSPEGQVGVIAIFDDVVRKIHQFDLDSMTHLRAIEVENPGLSHFLLHDTDGKYTVDMTEKHLSIYKSDGIVVENPVRFLGKPLSTSFRPELGYLVFYDDLQNVSILQVADDGSVLRARTLGPILDDVVIQSGDVTDNGLLVLAMADGTLRRVDLNQTLIDGTWSFETFNTTLESIAWVAPVSGFPNRVLLRAKQTIAVYDFDTSTVTSQMTTTEQFRIYKYSKSHDSHLVLAEVDIDGFWETVGETQLVYAGTGDLQVRTLPRGENQLMLSHLDIANNSWSVIQSEFASLSSENNINGIKQGRRLFKSSFSDGLALGEEELPNDTKVKLSRDYVFALFPSELGYARRINIETGEVKEISLFNLGHIE